MRRALRAWVIALVLGPAAVAWGQDDMEEEEGSAQSSPAQPPPAQTSPTPPPPAQGPVASEEARAEDDSLASDDGPPPDTGEVPAEATTSVVVDERAAELRREQMAMEDDDDAPDPDVEEEDTELSHLYQVGIRAGIGVPFFFGIEYGGGPPCDDEGDTFCFFVGSGFIDVDLSFGVTEDLEITALGRIGVVGSQPTDQNRLLFGLGIRSLLMPRDVVKLFLGARVIVDVTQEGRLAGMAGFDWGPVDFGVRGEFGLQVDVIRYLGIYAQIGVNVLFLRAFGITGDASAGLQARFP